MSNIAAGVLKQQLATIEHTRAEGKWLTRQQVADVQDNIRHALTGLPMPTSRLDAFDNCRELWRECQRWLGDIEATRLAHNQALPRRCWSNIANFLIALSRPRSMRHKRVR
jgi:DNA helicase-4